MISTPDSLARSRLCSHPFWYGIPAGKLEWSALCRLMADALEPRDVGTDPYEEIGKGLKEQC